MSDSLAARFKRRVVTVPATFLAASLMLALFPVVIVLALLVDLLTRRARWPTSRLMLFSLSFLLTECAGINALFLVWLISIGSRERRIAVTYKVQNAYTLTHMWSVRTFFSLKFEVEGAEFAAAGPLIVLVRHSSIIDVLIPGVFLAVHHDLHLRYVLKRELLWEPCLDIAGNWLPNHFVARGGPDAAKEIDAVRALKSGLGANEGVLIYPEGTRFTKSKQAAVIAKADSQAGEYAKSLRHLLPPRPAGTLALLAAQPACDVLFVGHSGLEGFAQVSDIARGRLTGRTVRIRMWREDASTIPAEETTRREWLQAKWLRMDEWLRAVEGTS